MPTQASSNKPYLLVQGGKDHLLRLFDRTNLSGQGGPGHLDGELSSVPVSDEMHSQPALWVDDSGTTWVFCVDDGGNLYAFKLVITNGTPKLVQVYKNTTLGVSSSPFIANGVLYLDAGSILAVDPTTGTVLFDSKSIGITIAQHWESPIVVNGTLFTSDNASSVYALSNPSAIPPPPPPAPQPYSYPYSNAATNSYANPGTLEQTRRYKWRRSCQHNRPLYTAVSLERSCSNKYEWRLEWRQPRDDFGLIYPVIALEYIN